MLLVALGNVKIEGETLSIAYPVRQVPIALNPVKVCVTAPPASAIVYVEPV